ncbi:hypothetical protein CK203_114780 [Vitis vinifera]|uniref:Uncharacterized protein n=1 Tax=Vitis vinifera TaxID=29760 RepID=A0A438BPF7_VITVI|nr:hypothetical protein CK203_114780 [Vitis vinifera]
MEELRAKQQEIVKRDSDIKVLEAIIQTLGGKESSMIGDELCCISHKHGAPANVSKNRMSGFIFCGKFIFGLWLTTVHHAPRNCRLNQYKNPATSCNNNVWGRGDVCSVGLPCESFWVVEKLREMFEFHGLGRPVTKGAAAFTISMFGSKKA